jgi:hypothetical protein
LPKGIEATFAAPVDLLFDLIQGDGHFAVEEGCLVAREPLRRSKTKKSLKHERFIDKYPLNGGLRPNLRLRRLR